MNLAVDTLPQFQCCKLSHPDAGPQHVGTIHIGSERYAQYVLFCWFWFHVFSGLPIPWKCYRKRGKNSFQSLTTVLCAQA